MSSPLTNTVASANGPDIDWATVVAVLCLPVKDTALPTTTKCPLCDGPLTVYQNTKSERHWHNCQACGSSGGMIELVSRAWHLSIAATEIKLKQLGHEPTQLSSNEAKNETYHSRALALFESAGKSIIKPTEESRAITKKLGVIMDFADNQRKIMANLIGIAKRGDIERVWSDVAGTALSPNGPHRIFRGGGWKDILMFPYFVAPDRIGSSVFIGRGCDRTEDEIFRSVMTRPTPGDGDVVDAGIGGLNAVKAAADSSKVFAYHDWLTVVKMQARYLHAAAAPLPVVAYKTELDIRTKDWSALNNKQLIFWVPEVTAEAVYQAVHTDGYMAHTGPDELSDYKMHQYLTAYPGSSLLTMLGKQAKPWPKVVKRWLETVNAGKADELLLQLEQFGVDVGYVLKRCGSHITTVDLGRAKRVRKAKTADFKVMERGGAWFTAASRERDENLLIDAVIRVTHILKDKDTRKKYAKGFVDQRGTRFPFIVEESQLRTVSGTWIRNLAAANNIAISNRAKMPDLLDIASAFYAPETVDSTSKVGWDKKTAQYNFGAFTLTKNGGVLPSVLIADNDMPGTGPAYPWIDDISSSVCRIAKYTAGKDSELWVGNRFEILSSILANMIAPAFGRPQRPILLISDDAKKCGKQIVQAMRGKLFELEPRDNEIDVNDVIEAGYPCYVSSTIKDKHSHSRQRFHQILTTPNTGTIIACTPEEALSSVIATGAIALASWGDEYGRKEFDSDIDVSGIVSTYMTSLLRRKPEEKLPSNDDWHEYWKNRFASAISKSVDVVNKSTCVYGIRDTVRNAAAAGMLFKLVKDNLYRLEEGDNDSDLLCGNSLLVKIPVLRELLTSQNYVTLGERVIHDALIAMPGSQYRNDSKLELMLDSTVVSNYRASAMSYFSLAC